jgi:hypothetical protein
MRWQNPLVMQHGQLSCLFLRTRLKVLGAGLRKLRRHSLHRLAAFAERDKSWISRSEDLSAPAVQTSTVT